ncbi:MAG: DNA polymerase III subunit chi [Tepidimonas sp.]|uniref:DNA polymerase III subunit chi n=1 Tax=Tepidimonas sp. TaxID=2002775 RepID=UPI00298F283A|nr:DNA polymerase III subunit chi [Tepidimonas sp.]MDW8335922.1 DNA polymerase III subunit chi [Tepidimonas sp.]
MTEVAFHLNVAADPVGLRAYLCRLLAKAYAARARVWVVVQAQEQAALDQALWTLPADDFVPHVGAGAPPLLRQRSPIVLATPEDVPDGGRNVLVNAQPAWLPWVATVGVSRIIEVVASDEPAKAAARQRWKRYQQQGWALQVHDRAARVVAEPGA